MIGDLSETLRAILTQPGVPQELAAAHIVFERPSDSFNPTQTTVDLFLYDLRENLDLRPSPPTAPAGSGQSRPVLSLACTYLITAWPVGGTELALQEQQILGAVLQVLASYPAIPAKFLRGGLVGQEPLPQMLVIQPDAVKNTSEFWASLGNKLRASLSVTVTFTVPAFQARSEPAPQDTAAAGPG